MYGKIKTNINRNKDYQRSIDILYCTTLHSRLDKEQRPTPADINDYRFINTFSYKKVLLNEIRNDFPLEKAISCLKTLLNTF